MQAKAGSRITLSHQPVPAGAGVARWCTMKRRTGGGIIKPKACQGRKFRLFKFSFFVSPRRSWSLFLKMSTLSFQFSHGFFFSVWEATASQTGRTTQRNVHSLYTRTQANTPTHSHTLVIDCSTCTECWRSKRGDKVFSAAWAETLQGQMSILHLRPGGLLSLCCHCKSHKPLLVLSLSRHPPPIHPYTQAPGCDESTHRRRGSSLGCGQRAHP